VEGSGGEHSTTRYVVKVNRAAPPKEPDRPEIGFVDITGHWVEASIMEAARQGWVNGYRDGTFRPGYVLTRQEWSAMLFRCFGWSEPKRQPNLTDGDQVPGWAKAAVNAAYERKVVTGFADGSFRPLEIVRRSEAAAMLARALKLEVRSDDRTTFTDDDKIPGWARPLLAAMQRQGLLEGDAAGRFHSDLPLTRAEAAELLARLKDRLPK